MNTLARYWQMWQIEPAAESIGYRKVPLNIAREFINNQVSDVENSTLQNTLLSAFNGESPYPDTISRARAGLCLRCYISEAILRECKKIDYLYSAEKQFSYRDLLPFVLNDDGQQLIILAPDSNTPLMVDDSGQPQTSRYNPFSIRVLQTFNANLPSAMSLDSWAYLQTRQNSELKKYLSEFGLKHSSDWAVLNKATIEQLERLPSLQRHIVEAYHAVYRRDRQLQPNLGSRRCPDPTSAQLHSMLVYLQQREVSINSPSLLLEQLRRIALELRRYDIWKYKESLEIYDPQSDTLVPRRDLPANSFDEEDIENFEIVQFLQEHLNSTLAEAIEQEIEANIQQLQNSQRYAPFARNYLWGLELYYQEAMTLTEITPILDMTSWNQARRILNPGGLLSQVRAKTVDLMLKNILNLAAQKGLTKIPPEANYFKNLIEKVEFYIDQEIFQSATEEMRAARNRRMNSTYAAAIRCYIQKCKSNLTD